MTFKRISHSALTLIHVMMPLHANHYGSVHGGTILQWVDEAAYAVASRHARCNVVTASLDHMSFKASVRVGDILMLRAALTYVGRTSMEVNVEITTERLTEGRVLPVGQAYLTMVGLDADGQPAPVPRLQLTSAAERREWRAAERRRALRLTLAGARA